MQSTYHHGRRKGFTIMELLIVMAVIGVIAAVALPTFNRARQNARNEIRRANLKTIQLALEKYYAVNKKYPSTCVVIPLTDGRVNCVTTLFSNTYPRWFYTCVSNCNLLGGIVNNLGNWVPGLVAEGYLPALPTDPQNEKTVSQVSAAAGTCLSGTRIYYRYRSNGFNYKLEARCGVEGNILAATDEMANPSDSAQASYRSMMVSSVRQPPSTACPAGGATTQLRHDSPACW